MFDYSQKCVYMLNFCLKTLFYINKTCVFFGKLIYILKFNPNLNLISKLLSKYECRMWKLFISTQAITTTNVKCDFLLDLELI